jgi:hypothetical protein
VVWVFCYVIWAHQCSCTFHVPDELHIHAGVGHVCQGLHWRHLGLLQNEEEQEQHLRIILPWLCDHPLYPKFSKCAFWLKEILFLGHVILAKGIADDPSKVQEVLAWKSARSVTQIHSFLELAEYYRRFIPNFSKIAKSMTTLLEKDDKFNWSLQCEEAFLTLKKLLTIVLVLAQPDIKKPFDVYCDASSMGIGGVHRKTAMQLPMLHDSSDAIKSTTPPMT